MPGEAVKPSEILRKRILMRRIFFSTVDVPMSRVKFNVNTEYAYLQNFKVLQSTSRQSVTVTEPIVTSTLLT